MIKVLIVDDEPLARVRLRSLMEEVGSPYGVAGEATTGDEALQKCAALGVDLVLMDISMPGMDGLTAAARLAESESPPAVIFTTAHGDYTLEAFEGSAIDYLLKPIRLTRLLKALKKAHAVNRVQIQALEQAWAKEKEAAESYICANIRGGVQRIPVTEIIYFIADQKYVSAFYQGGEVLLEESLRSFEEQLGDHFIRIHRNALVSRSHLAGLEKGADGYTVACLRETNQRLQVSRRHLSEIRRWLKGK
ncbi:Autolysis response regulater LytR [hydrothermal vent metagenome]|uniref:Autolysis response regulater LytR n=1 Tax=hydrothermal vent metagenome TaxID=652676 RepID=A0A3B1ANB8_9ZZZZ